jgi:hypothetical protein
MNDKIRYIHIGLPSGLTGMPVAYSFVGSERAEGSACEDGKRDTQDARCEEADRSLTAKSGALFSKASFGSFKSWCVQMIETGFAHPPA